MSFERTHPFPDPLWLARRVELAIEPDLPIIDPHHHLWDVANPRYLLDELLADIGSGHRIEKTVFIETKVMSRKDGPEELRTVGEIEFASGIAAMAETGLYGPTKICAGIVAHADLTLGERVQPVLEALERAGGGRLRGVRHNAANDPDSRSTAPAGLLLQADFRRGFALLQQQGYRFDAWLYHPQMPDLVDLLRAYPEARVVLNHIGGPIGIGRFAGRRAEAMGAWRGDLTELARFPNVFVKLGGMGMFFTGLGFKERPEPPSSDDLVTAWSDPIHTAIDLFGPDRCMFESNFPVDKISSSYAVLWNAFKKMTVGYSGQERQRMFYGSAASFYDI